VFPLNFFIFCEVRVISKESRLLLLPRTSVYLKQSFEEWTLPPSSGKKPTELGPIDRASPYLRTPEQ
jgi:hypothetical protein